MNGEGGKVDLTGAWYQLVDRVNVAGPRLLQILALAGAALLVTSLLRELWRRHRGSSSRPSQLVAVLVLAAVLASPLTVVPAILSLIDFAMNFLVDFFATPGPPVKG